MIYFIAAALGIAIAGLILLAHWFRQDRRREREQDEYWHREWERLWNEKG